MQFGESQLASLPTLRATSLPIYTASKDDKLLIIIQLAANLLLHRNLSLLPHAAGQVAPNIHRQQGL